MAIVFRQPPSMKEEPKYLRESSILGLSTPQNIHLWLHNMELEVIPPLSFLATINKILRNTMPKGVPKNSFSSVSLKPNKLSQQEQIASRQGNLEILEDLPHLKKQEEATRAQKEELLS